MKNLYFLLLLSLLAVTGHAATYYNVANSTTLQSVGQWGLNPDGSGGNPSNFTTGGDVFNLVNGTTGTISAAWVITGVTLNVGDGTNPINLTIPSGFSLSGTGVVNVLASATLTLNHTTNPTLGTLDVASTVDYAKPTGGQTIAIATYGNLTTSNTSGTQTAGGAITVNGNLTVGALSTMAMTTFKLTGGGSFTGTGVSGLLTTTATVANPLPVATWGGTVGYVSSAANENVASGTYNNLTIGSSGTRTFTAEGAITINGNLAFGISTSTLADGGFLITLAGNITGAAGKHSGTNKILMNGATATIIGSTNLGNIEFSTGNFSLLGATTFNGAVTFSNNATLAIGSNTLTVITGGVFTMAAGTALVGSASSNLTVSSTGNIGTLLFDQSNDGVSNNISTLTLSGAAGTTTLGSNLHISTSFNPSSATATLADGGNTVTLDGTFAGLGKHTGIGSIVMTGINANTIAAVAATGNLTLNNASGFTLAGSPTVTGALTFTNGQLSLSTFTLTIGSGGSLSGNNTHPIIGGASAGFTVSGLADIGTVYFDAGANTLSTFTVTGAGSKVTLGGDITVNITLAITTATSTLADGGFKITCAGNLTGAGIHTSTASGEIYMTGANKTMGALAATGNIELDNAAGFSLSGSSTLNGILTFTNGQLSIGAFTFTYANGGSLVNNSTHGFIGGSTSNFTVSATSDIGTIYFDQTGSNNQVATFTTSGGASCKVTMGSNITVVTSLTLTTGTIDDGGNVITVAGSIAGAGTHTSTGSGNITMTGANKSIAAVTLDNITFNTGSATSLGGNTTFKGVMTFTSGTLTIGAHTLIVGVGGSVSGMTSAKYMTGGTTSNITINATADIGTLFMDPTNVAGSSNKIATFTVNGAGASVTMGNDMVVATALALTSGKLAIGSTTLTLSGTVTGSTASNCLVGSASSNLTVTGAGAVGSVFFDQTTDGTSNNIATFTLNRTTVSTGTFTLGNKLIIGTACTLTSGLLKLNGQALVLNGTFSGIAGTGSLSGSTTSTLTITGSGTFGTLVMDQTTAGTTNAVGTLTFDRTGQTLTLGNSLVASTALNLTNGQLSVGGNTLTINGTLANDAANNIIGGASAALVIGSAGSYTLYLDESNAGVSNNFAAFTKGGAGTVTLNGDMTVGTTLTLTAGTLNDGGNLITLAGSFSGSGTHASTGTGEIKMTGSTPNITGVTVGNLELNNGTASNLTGSPTVKGILKFTSGTLNIGANTLTIGVGGSVANMNVARFITGGATSNLTVTATADIGTLWFDPSLANTSNKIVTFTMNGVGAIATLGNDLAVATTLALTNGTLNDGGHVITLSGGITGTGTHNSSLGGKISMTVAAKTIAGVTLGNLELNNAGATSIATANPTINGTLSFLSTSTFTITAGFGLMLNGAVTTTSSSNTFSGSTTSDLTFGGSGTIGTIYFGQTTTLNNIRNFVMTGGGTVTLGSNMTSVTSMDLSTSSGGHLVIGSNTLSMGGTFAGTSANGNLVGSATSNLTLTGTTAPTGTLYFDQTSDGTSNKIATFVLNKSGQSTTLGNKLVSGTALTLTLGKLILNGQTLELDGTTTGIVTTAVLQGSTGSTLIIGGTGALGSLYFDQTTDGTTNAVGTLTLNRITAGTATLATKMVVTSACTLTNGLLKLNGQTLELKGSTFSGIAGTASISGTTASTLTVDGSGPLTGNLIFDQTTPGTTNALANFTMNRTSQTATLGNDLVCATAFGITAGQVAIGSNTLTLNGTFSGSSTENLIGSAASNLTIGSASSYTLYFDESAAGTSNNIATFTKGGAGTATLGGDLSVGTALTLTAGTLADNGNVITLAGNITGTATHSSATGGKISMVGLSKTISAATLGNLDFNYPGGVGVFSLTGSPTINGTISFTGATNSLNLVSNTLTIKGPVTGMSATQYFTSNGTGTVVMNATGSTNTLFFDPTTPGTTNSLVAFTNTAGTTLLGNDMKTGTLTLTAGLLNDNGKVITLTGNIAGTGTHTSGSSGKISMVGQNKSISGATLGNIELNYPSGASAFTLSASPTINGNLAFTGATNTLTLGSTTLTLNGTVSGMSTTLYFTGSATSNMVVGATGALGTVFMNVSTAANRTLQTLTINGGGSMTMGSIALVSTTLALTSGTFNDNGNIITCTGNITGTGTHTSTGGGKITMTGLTKSISGATFGNLDLAAITTFSLTGSPTVNGLLSFSNGTLTVGSNTLTLNGTVSGMTVAKYFTGSALSNLTVTSTSALGTLFFDPTTGGTTNNFATFTMNGSGGTATVGNALSAGTLALTAGTLAGGANVITVTGNVTGTATHTSSGAGAINMTGTNATLSGATLGSLTLNGSGFSLTGSPTVNGTLTLTAGRLDLGSNNLSLAGAAAVAGTPASSNMIVTSSTGEVRKTYTGTGSYVFPIGDNAGNYTPLTINVTAGTFGGSYVGIHVTNSKPSQNANTNNYLNRYWTVNTSNITSPAYSLTATYVPGDIVGTESLISGAKYTGSLPWVKFSTLSSNTLTTTSIANTSVLISGVTGSSPTVTSSANTTICNGGSTALSVVSSTGTPTLSYTWAPAAGLSATTGTSVTASPTVTTTYTVTVTDGNNETATSQTIITVTPAPAAAPTNDGYICNGGTVNLVANPSGSTSTYSWSGANLAATTVANPTATPTSTNTYTLTVTNGTANAGCSVDFTTTVNVHAAPTAGPTNDGYICNGGTVNLTANPANGATTYTWSGSSLSSSTTQNPTAAPTASTIYTLTVSDGSGKSGCAPTTQYTTAVTVNAVPTAGPTNNGYICNGGTVTLTANPTAGANTYTWSGSSLSSTTTQNPTATPTASTVYTLTVSDGSGKAGCSPATQYTTAVTVNATPTAAPANDGYICNGGTVNLSANPAGGANTYTWSGSSLSSSTTQNPSATPTANTVYTLTVSDGSGQPGCAPSTQYTTTVNVHAAPTAAPTNDGYICNGGTVNLTANPANGATAYTWSGSSLSSATTQNPSATPTASTVYTLTVSDGSGKSGCAPAAQYTTAVTVNAVPTAGPTNNGYICNGGTVTLTANPTAGANTYTWSGSNLASATDQNPTATPTANTVYTLTVTDGSGKSGCSPATQYTTAVTVNATPTAAPANDGYICNGGTVNLSANPAGGANTYTWSGSSLSSSTTQNPSATPTANTVYTLTVSDGSGQPGCAPATQYTTAVSVNPTPTAVPTNNGYICNGGTVTLTANPAGGATAYTWSGSSLSSSTAQNPTATPTASTVYTLTVSDGSSQSGCAPATQYTTAVTVNAVPTAAPTNNSPICPSGTVTLTANPAGGAVAYSWSGANLSSATAQNPTATPTVTTVYTLTVSDGTAHQGCAPATQYTTSVTVNPGPSLTGASNGGPVCSGNTLNLFANGPANVTDYSWVGPNSFSSTLQNPSISSATTAASGTYTVTVNNGTGGGCVGTYTTAATVSPTPASITGVLTTCEGNFTVLADATTGGSWLSSNTGVATIGSSTGSVQGVMAGNATMTYKIGATGCYVTADVTVNVQPAVITGTASFCFGTTTTLADAVSGGVWSTSNATVAPIDVNGVVTGGNPGTAIISYTMGSGSGCRATKTVTVNGLPGNITGTPLICEGKTVTLTDATTGGTWTSSDVATATVGSSSGVLTGVLAGNANITYTNSNGCYRFVIATVNQSPAAITGNTPVCTGSTITLDNTVAGGTWSSSGAAASIGSATGILTGVSVGGPIISYTLANGCRATATGTVNTTPTAFGGNFTVCVGSTVNLTSTPSGGTWVSSDVALATVGTTGIVTGVSGGNPVITYTLSTGCYNTKQLTVNPIAPITGGGSGICVGATLTLGETVPGGVWSSSTTSRATVDATTGVATGVAAGATNISYTMPSGCKAGIALNVNPISAITGTAMACEGLTTTLADAAVGGAWSSSDVATATVGTSGVVTGVLAGVATISYIMPTGCFAIRSVTINQSPAAITGGSTVCAGSTLTLNDAVSGGTWSSSSASIATVGSATGIVTGVAGGNATITYSNGPGCSVTKAVTVNAILPITGTNSACIGMTTTLSDGSAGGAWASSDVAVATVGISGIVSGVSQGTATITYTLPSGCARTIVVSVNPVPLSITGTGTVCASLTTTLSGDNPGGTWSSSNAAIATVGATTGIVTGVAAGNATMTYTMGLNCRITTVVTVSSSAAITGTAIACIGTTTTLSHPVTGGTWSSSIPAIATIGSASGVVTGVASGTTTVTYTPPSGCVRTIVVTVNVMSGANSGVHTVCVGSTTVLTNSTPGGVSWSSSNPSVATIGATSGIATGVSAGTSTMTYTISSGCYATSILTVNAVPASITGGSSVCVASTITLADATTGGTWTSSNVSLASVGSASGVVTGVAAGAPRITYTLTSGCYLVTTVTVLANTANTGTVSVCVGTTATLSNATTGGVWSSSNALVASVGTGGVVTGVGAGNADITYTNPAGCIRISTATVNTTPAAITGSQAVCVGFSTTLADATVGGAWTGSNATVGSIGTTGIVTGLTAGTTNISYSIGSCRTTAIVTVNPLPSAITGTTSVCVGFATTLGSATSGGTWASSNVVVATIGTSGIVNGLAAGNATMTYTLPTGCLRTAAVVVNPTPSAVTGTLQACPGTTTVVGSATGGGVSWSSSTPAVATVGSTSGIVTGVSAGTSRLTYTVNTGCYVTGIVTINPLPAAITGASDVCPGLTITLADADLGGTWTSHYVIVGSASGIVTGVGSGVREVTYTLPTGCAAYTNVTVNPVADIAGNIMVCLGATKTLSNTVTGGTWVSSNTAVATIGSSTGEMVTTGAGTTTISYTTPPGCIITREETVNAVASSGTISGPSTVVVGLQVTLSDDISGGAWASSNTGVATIEANTGIVTGVAAGAAVMSYTVNNGCGPVTGTYTVNVTTSRSGGNMAANTPEVELTVFPNPNKGEFTIKGSLPSSGDQDVYIEVANMLGQVIYRENIVAHGGVIEQKVTMGNTLSNGMYTLKLNLPGESKVFHFVVNQ